MSLHHVPTDPEFFGFLCSTLMADSFDGPDTLKETVQRYEKGECKLYTVRGVGFLILSWHESSDGRYLEIEQAKGNRLCSRKNMQKVIDLACCTGCSHIIATAKSNSHKRLYKRIGFEGESLELTYDVQQKQK